MGVSEREAGKESRGGGSDLENMKAFVSHCRKFGLNTKVGESQEQGAVRREGLGNWIKGGDGVKQKYINK